MVLKYFFNSIGCSNIYYNNDYETLVDFHLFFKLNDTISNISNISNVVGYNNILFIGTNTRLELPILNAILRRNCLKNMFMRIYSIGLALNHTTFPVSNLGNSTKTLLELVEGRLLSMIQLLFNDYFNLLYFGIQDISINIFIGSSITKRLDNISLSKTIIDFCITNILKTRLHFIHSNLGRISFSELGLGPDPHPIHLYRRLNNLYESLIYLYGIDIDA